MDSPEPVSGAQAAKAIVWTENSRPHARQERQASLIVGFGGPTETKKARSVVASSRVPRWAGFAGSPPAAGLPRTVNWPLVQIPADRHTTTGTCVLGSPLLVRNSLKRKRFFRLALKIYVIGEARRGKERPVLARPAATGGRSPDSWGRRKGCNAVARVDELRE